MGSYISIGFVFRRNLEEKIDINFKKLVNFLVQKSGKLNSIKVSKDMDGEEWIEVNVLNDDSRLDLLTEFFYGQLNLSSNIIDGKSLEIIIHIENKPNYYGFLLDIQEADLIKTNSIEELDYISDKLIKLMVDFYGVSGYDYAFCDHEANIEYSPNEFLMLEKNIYSITIITNHCKNNLEIRKSNWHIDGLTKRS
jgi:hypothetical protein